MSGRGVMTSRTSVSPKSTIDCSSRALLPLDQPFVLAGFEVSVCATSSLFVVIRRLGAGAAAAARSRAASR